MKDMEHRDEKLDLVRGASALFVLAGHARNFLMVDAADVAAQNYVTKLFYLLTSIHHQAVMVFFVLSGYFVGGSVLNALSKGRFSWVEYLIARLSRLWMVLIPALFLTLLLDFLCRNVAPDAYAGSLYHLFISGPSVLQPADHGISTFLANTVFLQTWTSPVYGTNGPLWSLANEFWYYILFPLAAVAALVPSLPTLQRISSLVVFGLICFFIPQPILNSGLIWLMGVVVWKMSRSQSLRRVASGWWWMIIGGGLFLGSVLGAKAGLIPYADFVVGAVFACWMPSLLGAWRRSGLHQRTSFALSEISFSLYIIHFPLMFLLVAVFLKGKMYQPDANGLAIFCCLILVSIAITAVFWRCFESKTPWLRRRMRGAYQKICIDR